MRNPFNENNPENARRWFGDFQNRQNESQTDRIFRSTKQSDYLYRDLFSKNPDLQTIVDMADKCFGLGKILEDLFTLLYSPVQQRNNPSQLDTSVLPLQKPFINSLMKSEAFQKLKELCENKELPAFSAVKQLATDLGTLKGDSRFNSINTLITTVEMLKNQNRNLSDKATYETNPQKQTIFINRIYKKQSQINNLMRKVKEKMLKAEISLAPDIEKSAEHAADAAGQTAAILSAFGDGDGDGKATEGNAKILDTVRKNDVLKQISVILGKYREILADKRKNSFSYGLGEKYDITVGNDINNCLSSELALLGTPETEVLFLQKYYQGRLQQYRKREPAKKGDGDMIVLIDESSSTRELAPWIKAFALALLDIAMHGNKKYALIHFANAHNVKVDRFEKGKFTIDDVLSSAEHFFGGGTDFEAPLSQAVELLDDGFEKADMVMITDGICSISNDFAENFKQKKLTHKVTVTGVLLDKDGECGGILVPFCDKIYHTSELSKDEIAIDVLSRKAT